MIAEAVVPVSSETPLRAEERGRYRLFLKPVYTYQDYLSWPDNFRAEIVEGEIFIMAAPTFKHQKIQLRLSSLLDNYLKGKEGDVVAAPFTVRLFPKSSERDVTVFEPDVVVVLDKSKISEKAIIGAPDMVVEIISPSSALYDQNVKLDKYEEAGVKEYWIVDPDAKTVRVNILENGEYSKKTVYTSGDIPVGVLPGCVVKVEDILH